MADAASKDAAVQVGGAYVENEGFTPNPTDLYGTFNTSGTGAHHDPATVSPIFDVDRQQVAQEIVSALDPDDDSVDSSRVLFSEPQAVVSADNEGEKEALLAKAKARLANPVVVGGDTHLDEEAAESGPEGARAASEQEAATSSSTSTTAGSHSGANAGEAGSDDEAEGASAPAESANKAEWVDYAVSQGATKEEAEGKTKADLVKEYGA